MDYRLIPQTEIRVSSICLGSMNWGQQNTEREAHDQLDYATHHGVNFIDTSEIYPIPPEPEKQGGTELYLGSWLRKRGNRDDLVIASKVSPSNIIRTRRLSADGIPRLDRGAIRDAIEGTLTRLGLEYLDLYQVHWPERKTNFFGLRGYPPGEADRATPIEETLDALAELVQEGKVRRIGVSNETAWGISEYQRIAREKKKPQIATIQNQYSLLNRTFEIGLAEFALREHIGLLAYSPLSMGVLTGKYLNGAKPAGARFTLFMRNEARYNPPHAQTAISRYVEIAQKHGLDPAAMAIAFVTSRPFTTSTIVGATSVAQLAADIAAGDLVLSSDVLADIENIYREIPDPTV
jgi:aryl-alcohol dehydrogenase-like predicted oxidoreductase